MVEDHIQEKLKLDKQGMLLAVDTSVSIGCPFGTQTSFMYFPEIRPAIGDIEAAMKEERKIDIPEYSHILDLEGKVTAMHENGEVWVARKLLDGSCITKLPSFEEELRTDDPDKSINDIAVLDGKKIYVGDQRVFRLGALNKLIKPNQFVDAGLTHVHSFACYPDGVLFTAFANSDTNEHLLCRLSRYTGFQLDVLFGARSYESRKNNYVARVKLAGDHVITNLNGEQLHMFEQKYFPMGSSEVNNKYYLSNKGSLPKTDLRGKGVYTSFEVLPSKPNQIDIGAVVDYHEGGSALIVYRVTPLKEGAYHVEKVPLLDMCEEKISRVLRVKGIETDKALKRPLSDDKQYVEITEAAA